MMKGRHGNPGGGGTARVNLVILQMDGDTSVLTKSIESFVHAMSTKGNVAPPRAIANATPSPELIDESDESAVGAQDPADESVAEAPHVAPRVRTARRKLKLVEELRVDQESPFSAFCAGKEPKDWATKVLLAGAWLAEHRSRQDFTADDIYTCLRHQWNAAPDDLQQMLRDMTRRELLQKAASKGAYSLSMMSAKKLKKAGTAG